MRRSHRSLSREDDPTAAKIQPVVVGPQACRFMPGSDPYRLNQLVDEIELEAFLAQHTQKGEGD